MPIQERYTFIFISFWCITRKIYCYDSNLPNNYYKYQWIVSFPRHRDVFKCFPLVISLAGPSTFERFFRSLWRTPGTCLLQNCMDEWMRDWEIICFVSIRNSCRVTFSHCLPFRLSKNSVKKLWEWPQSCPHFTSENAPVWNFWVNSWAADCILIWSCSKMLT